jgi:hypothetical protein
VIESHPTGLVKHFDHFLLVSSYSGVISIVVACVHAEQLPRHAAAVDLPGLIDISTDCFDSVSVATATTSR